MSFFDFDSESLSRSAGLLKQAGLRAGKRLVSGVSDAAGDVADAGRLILDKNPEEAVDIVADRTAILAKGVLGACRSGIALARSGYGAVTRDEDFITPENEAHLARVLSLGAADDRVAAPESDSGREIDPNVHH